MTADMKDNPINQAAFDWLARADAGLTAVEEAELAAWLDADTRHYGAYARARAVLGQARRIKAFAHAPDPDNWVRHSPIEKDDLARKTESEERGSQDEVATGRVARRAFLGGAGAVAAAGLATAFFATSRPAQALTYRTGRGERRDILLADGTKVALNTDTELRVLFGKKRRTMELLRGEALCNVAYDIKRPFVVDARGFEVRVSEASFAIQQFPDALPQVIVTEGMVDLVPDHATSLAIAAPTKVTFLTGNRLAGEVLSPEALNRELLWREGKIAFEDTPLRAAIATFGRYGPVPIDIADQRLLNRTVSGVFSSDDPLGFARVVAELFDLDARPEGSGIALRPRR